MPDDDPVPPPAEPDRADQERSNKVGRPEVQASEAGSKQIDRHPDPRAGQLTVITRDRLLDGSLLADIRARAPADATFLSDDALQASLDGMLARHPQDQDAWLFGYGSLMWNPAIHFCEQRTGRIIGWHRRYCLWIRMGRGTPERPGLMLALDRGGSCNGMLFRIPAADARAELLLAWRREMAGGSYAARWVTAKTAAGPVRAIAFVVRRDTARYAPGVPDDQLVDRLATAGGELGTCATYLIETSDRLRDLGMPDPYLERLRAAVECRVGSATD